VGWRRWRSAAGALATACLAAGVARPAYGLELRRIATRATPDGAEAVLVLSATARVPVQAVEDRAGTASRVYVDLPRGTRLGLRVPPLLDPPAPLARLRIGLGERGQVRVVIDVDPAARWDVRREGRTVRIALRAPAAAPPPSSPVETHDAAPAPAPASPIVPASLGHPKIVLDPGHGGHDPGAQGYAVEKDVTLAIARRLAVLLRERLGADVVLTRTGDATLPLAARTARANAEGADLFL